MKQKTQKQIREEEREFKRVLDIVRTNLIKQNEGYFKLYLDPNDDLIKSIDRYLRRSFKVKGITKEELIFRINKRNERVKEVRGLNGI